MTPGLGLLVMLACAAFYYKVGEAEYSSGFLPAAISILLWLGSAHFLHWGILGCILGQVGLFAALTAWNMLRSKLS